MTGRTKKNEPSLKKPPISAEVRKKIAVTRSKLPRKMSTLMHYADTAFSRYIRYSYADGRGNLVCFTCDVVKPIAEMDCGHFVSRQHKATRFMEKNAHPQCRFCNRYNEGRKDVYALRLVQKYGPNILLELQEEKTKVLQLKQSDLEEIARTYKEKLEAL